MEARNPRVKVYIPTPMPFNSSAPAAEPQKTYLGTYVWDTDIDAWRYLSS
jgi:hypothetical protein